MGLIRVCRSVHPKTTSYTISVEAKNGIRHLNGSGLVEVCQSSHSKTTNHAISVEAREAARPNGFGLVGVCLLHPKTTSYASRQELAECSEWRDIDLKCQNPR